MCDNTDSRFLFYSASLAAMSPPSASLPVALLVNKQQHSTVRHE